jgi:hypothetical protein
MRREEEGEGGLARTAVHPALIGMCIWVLFDAWNGRGASDRVVTKQQRSDW